PRAGAAAVAWPCMGGRPVEPAGTGRARPPTGVGSAASGGSAAAADGSAYPTGRPAPSTRTATTCGPPASATERPTAPTVAVDGTATAGRARPRTVSPETASRVRPTAMAWPAPLQRNAPMSAAHATVHRSGRAPYDSGHRSAHATTPTATARPTQPAATVPLVREPVAAHTAASRI